MKKQLFFYIFVALSQFLFSQREIEVNYVNTPLDQVIKNVEKEFQITISYNARITEKKIINLTQTSIGLSALLKEIEQQTSLLFSQVDLYDYILQKIIPTNDGRLCGTIYNARSRLPLGNVSIYQPSTKRGTTSDEKGKLTLPYISLEEPVEIRLLGFTAIRINPKSFTVNDCPAFFLEEDTFDLDEILVKDYLFSGFYKNKDGSIKTKPKEMQLLNGVTSSDVLRNLQFLSGIQSPDETATGLNIRGGTPDQKLILWAGIKLYRSDHLFGMVSSLNPNVIEDVKVYKNASLARYSNHISGVIDIRSESKIPEKTTVGFGTNMLYSDVFVKTPIQKDLALIVSARKSITDYFETVTFENIIDQVFQNSEITTNNAVLGEFLTNSTREFDFYDFSAKVISKLGDKGELSFSSLYSENKFDLNEEFADIQRNTQERIDVLNNGFGLNWKQQWSDRFSTESSVQLSHYNFEYSGGENLDNFQLFVLSRTNRVNDLTFNFQTNYILSDTHKFINGYSFTNNEIELGLNIFDTTQTQFTKNNTHAIFNEYHYNDDQWNVILGNRMNYFSNTETWAFEPRLRVSKAINSNMSINLGAERQFQPLSQVVEFDANRFGSQNRTWVLADNDLVEVLESSQISLGGNYRKNKWYVSAEGYFKKIHNLTSLSTGLDANFNGYFNGSSTIFGVDVLAKKQYDNFTTLISYSFANNDLQFDELNNGLEFPSDIDVRHNFTFVQAARFEDFELSLSWKFRTATPFTPSTGLTPDPVDPFAVVVDFGALNSERLTNYHRMDFSGKYKFKLFKENNNDVVVGISILNLYNRRNLLNRTYRIIENAFDGSLELREIDRISLARTPNLFFRLEF